MGALGAVLREYRDRKRWSQSKLADMAGFDHSYISRIESGTRYPTRMAVLMMSSALELTSADEDRLLIAAGFAPADPTAGIAHEPVIAELFAALDDPAIHDDIKHDLRLSVTLAIRQALRSVAA